MRRAFVACSLSACLAALPSCTRPGAPVPPASPAAAPSSASDALRWVLPTANVAQQGGAGAPLVVATGSGAPGDSLGGRVEIPPDVCGLFLARGSASIQDLDLFVYADDGAVLGADETQEAGGSALVCPPHPQTVYAFGRIAAGHGLFTVSAQTVRPADANRAAHAAGVPSMQEQAIGESGWPGLDDALAARRLELGGVWRVLRHVAVPMDPRIPTHVTAPIGPEQCLDVLVLPADEVAFAELTVLDAGGRIIGRAPNEGQRPAMVVCSAARSQVTFELQPHAGRGMAALVLSVTGDQRALDPGATLSLGDAQNDRTVDEARADLDRTLGAAHGTKALLARGAAAIGRRESRDVDLTAGCSRLDVVAGAPLRGVEAWLWSAAGSLLAHDNGNALATLFACGPAGRARLDVEAVTRSGPYALELRTTRVQAGVLPQLADHPLAASRLLGRLSSAARITTPEAAGTPMLLDLNPTTLVRRTVDLPPGDCVDVAVGIDAGAEGVEVRVTDVTTKEELAFVRGTYSALSTVCALERNTPQRLEVEVRAAAGSAKALLAAPMRPGRPIAKPSAAPPSGAQSGLRR